MTQPGPLRTACPTATMAGSRFSITSKHAVYAHGRGSKPAAEPSGAMRPSPSDRALASRPGRARDPDALAEIYGQWGPLALGVARRVTSDEVLAEDVVQEVFAYLWDRPDRYDAARGDA